MKVIVDTNILVSAVLRDRVPQDVLLFISGTPGLEWVASPEIMAEYKEVLGRKKFNLPLRVLKEWENFLAESITVVEADLAVEFERDRKDAKFLACALSIGADWLITGDKDFQVAEKIMDTTIIPVSMFKRTVMDSWTE